MRLLGGGLAVDVRSDPVTVAPASWVRPSRPWDTSQRNVGTDPLSAPLMVRMVAAGSGVVMAISGVETRRAAKKWDSMPGWGDEGGAGSGGGEAAAGVRGRRGLCGVMVVS